MTRIILIALIAWFAIPTAAQATCALRQEVHEKLSRHYQEHPVALGITGDGRLIEVLVSTAGSWTILLTAANGITCVFAAGEDWQALPDSQDAPQA